MIRKSSYYLFLIITIVYGLLFGFTLNLYYDRLVEILFPSLAVTIVFLAFLLPLLLLIIIFSRRAGTHNKLHDFTKVFIFGFAAFCVSVFVFELLYELNVSEKVTEPDSYIILIDD